MQATCTRDDVATEPTAPDDTGWALIVDDNAIDRRTAGRFVERATGLKVQNAGTGLEALKVMMKDGPPTIVLTDMQMPHMGGLELVEEIVAHYPTVPVILMTAQGSEEIAIEALRRGASGYVPKRNIESLKDVLPQVLARAKIDRRRQELNQFIDNLSYSFVLENDPVLVQLLVARLQDYLFAMKLCGQNDKTRVGVALEEALLNGLYHGNLEVSSDLKQDGSNEFTRVAEERRHAAPYCERKLYVQVSLNHSEGVFTIRDEGPGFDPSKLPDPTDPENLLKASGRGILLIRTFMDEVTHSANGNQITMVKRRRANKAPK